MSVHFVLCVDGLHLSISAQGMPNGEAALQHAAYPGMQPYPGVGMFGAAFFGAPLFSLSFSLVATTTPFGKAFWFWLRHSVVFTPLSIYLSVCLLETAPFLLTSSWLPHIPVHCLFVDFLFVRMRLELIQFKIHWHFVICLSPWNFFRNNFKLGLGKLKYIKMQNWQNRLYQLPFIKLKAVVLNLCPNLI